MRIVITGGTGMIGRALAASLVADGHAVDFISRSPERHAGTLPPGVSIAAWDGRTAAGWGHLVDGADAVFNLAGESIGDGRWTAERKRRIVQSRRDAGAAVVAAVGQAGAKPGVVIQPSAVGYYGSWPEGGPRLTESAPPGHDFLAGVCQDWEASTAPVESLGVRRVVARFGVILSTDGGALPRMLLPFKLLAGGPIGGGKQVLSWIHLADVVGGLRFLVERPDAAGVFNLTAPAPAPNAAFARAIGRAMGRPSLIPAPAFALKLAFGEMAVVVLEGQHVVPERLTSMRYPFRFDDLDVALGDLLGPARAEARRT